VSNTGVFGFFACPPSFDQFYTFTVFTGRKGDFFPIIYCA